MKKLSYILLLMIAATVAMPQQSLAQEVTLRLLETSDLHGHFFPIDITTGKPVKGSLAQGASLIKRLRAENPDGVVLLDNGDIMQGTPLSYYTNYVDTAGVNIAAECINFLQYDAQSVGNHDVETGRKVMDKWLSEVRCPRLGANILDAATGLPHLKPYTIVERQGVRVAVLGLLTPAIPNWLAPAVWQGLKFQEMVSSARYWVNFIRENEHADVVVGLFHSGLQGGIATSEYEENASRRVATEVDGFDVVFYGHDHRRYNETVKGPSGRDVLLLNPANNAHRIAQATITLAETAAGWQVTGKQGELLDVNNEPADEAFMAHFAPKLQQARSWVTRRIGTTTQQLDSRESFAGNSAFNDLILDLMLKITGADIAINAPLSPNAVIAKGDITVGDMFDLYKYENQLWVLEMTGDEIRRHLEMGYGLWVNTITTAADHVLAIAQDDKGDWWFKNPAYNFDSAAGIKYEVDVTKPQGERVRIVSMQDGSAFDPAKTYRVAMNSYRANGGGELVTRGAGISKEELEKRIVSKSERDQRHYLMEAIQQQGKISPKAGTNWKFVPEKLVKPAMQRDLKLVFPNWK